MSRGKPVHGRRNQPFSASLRNRWWCDLVIRKHRQDRVEGPEGGAAGARKRNRRGGPAETGTHAKVREA